ncbi:von Willebrand factor type A domain protein [Rubripirellula tenax]|uniref:von Willebrand factor type A domain protein n=1 Tax=Rubripirellula tenax TaxID=2528015 RepID=A0A5C6E9H2_9BACT|nr:VWA domain-containing protein [Rubripirellula tenax]TWU46333.1 von Willebrand factor type A domain protein [Rubripirellula tenax]
MRPFHFRINHSFAVSLTCWFAFAGAVVADDTDRQTRVLVRQLTGRSESVRQNAISRLVAQPKLAYEFLPALTSAAIEQTGQTQPGQLVRPSTVRLLYLIGSIDHTDAESVLVDLLDDDHTGIVMIAADSLGKNKHYGSIEFLKRQVDRPEFDSHYGFRFNLVRALAQMEHPDAVEFLGDLESKLDGQLHFEVAKLLTEVNESHFLGDQARFERWQASKPPKIVFQKASFDSQSGNGRIRMGASQKYYDIDIHAKRLMFVIDRSGSMKDYDGGMTRLERAKFELIKAIKELPADSEFGITFFETSVRQWREKLLIASEENKRDAIVFVERLGYGDRTNTYQALRETLDFDEQLEVVFLISDGKPTFGELTNPSLIVADIMHRNRFRNVNFNTIGIAVTGPAESFLKTLAEQSAGEYRSAN